jgi:transmembrane sensor
MDVRPLPQRRRGYAVWWAAAGIALMLGAGALFIARRSAPHTPPQLSVADIPPGGKKAILILKNGSQVVLNGRNKGVIADEKDVTVEQNGESELRYQRGSGDAGAGTHQLVTPAGGQYNLTLADGTKVWLNAASHLTFPSHFSGGARTVSLTGEAYFEVARKESQPFIVQVDNNQVEVLGTHFNISAYHDEPQKTTLLEGAVRVKAGASSEVLSPGKQAIIIAGEAAIKVLNVNTEGAVAWKEGFIYMKDETLENIMRKLARWYDVDVSYDADVDRTLTFSGVVSNNKSIRSVLNIMESTGDAHFILKGRSIRVTR